MHLYEDLFKLGRTVKLKTCVEKEECVLNASNTRRGVEARRGDGTFGDRLMNRAATCDTGFVVPRGPIANVHIGVEVKILSKAMIKQADRVSGDLRKQAAEFKRGGSHAICVAIVGINGADYTISYEGARAFRTDGTARYRHPVAEAAAAERKLRKNSQDVYDEFIVLRYRATNDDPFRFEWLDLPSLEDDYVSSLIRISRDYDRRF